MNMKQRNVAILSRLSIMFMLGVAWTFGHYASSWWLLVGFLAPFAAAIIFEMVRGLQGK
jgi:hypothetical protein